MQETLRNAVAVAVVVLGGLAFFAFPFRPSLPWIALAGIPALLLARVLAGWSVEALRLRRSPLYGEPDRRFLRLLHGTVMFAGAYLFCCLFAGAALTLAFGEHHLRPGVIRTWHPQSNHPRRGHGCTRVSAVIETPRRRIPVDMCVSNRPGTRLWPGARVAFSSFESFFGDLVDPTVYSARSLPRTAAAPPGSAPSRHSRRRFSGNPQR